MAASSLATPSKVVIARKKAPQKKHKQKNAFRIHAGITVNAKPPPMRIYIKNVASTCNESAIRSIFSKLGSVSSLDMPLSRASGRHFGFAFLTIDCASAQARTDVFSLNGKKICDRALVVENCRGNPITNRTSKISELLSSDTSSWTLSDDDIIQAICSSASHLRNARNHFAASLIDANDEHEFGHWAESKEDEEFFNAGLDGIFEMCDGNDNLSIRWAGIRVTDTKEILIIWSRGRFGWTQIVTDLLSGKEGLDPSAINKRIEGARAPALPKRQWRCNGNALEIFIPTDEDLKLHSTRNDMIRIKRGRFCDEHMKSDKEWQKYQKLALMKKDLYSAMKRRRAERCISVVEASKGGLNQNVPGYNLYEFARRFLKFQGNLEQFLTDPRHGPFAMKSKLLVCILQYHKDNEANGFVEKQEQEGIKSDEELRKTAEAEIKARVVEGFDVFYFSIGGEHKMRPDTPQRTGADLEIARSVGLRQYLKHANQPNSFVGVNEVHAKVFPKEKRICMMRAAVRDNAERYEPILIETAFQKQKEGKIVLLNRLHGEKATRANLRRSQCGCYLYSEVWGCFTTKADLAADGYTIV